MKECACLLAARKVFANRAKSGPLVLLKVDCPQHGAFVGNVEASRPLDGVDIRDFMGYTKREVTPPKKEG